MAEFTSAENALLEENASFKNQNSCKDSRFALDSIEIKLTKNIMQVLEAFLLETDSKTPIQLEPFKDLLTIPVQANSVTHNSRLMASLFEFSKMFEKNFFSIAELRQVVKLGELSMQAILTGKGDQLLTPLLAKLRPEHKNKAYSNLISSIGWYLQAKNGEKVLLNPETWHIERAFVEGGTFRFKDPNHRVFEFLHKIKQEQARSPVHRRPSSHFKESRLDSFGYDFDIPEDGIKPPGHNPTHHFHYGPLEGQETFFKFEDNPISFPPKSLKELKQTTAHLKEWMKHRKIEASGFRYTCYAHRESTNKHLRKEYKTFFNSLDNLVPSKLDKPSDQLPIENQIKKEFSRLKKDGLTHGIGQMILNLESTAAELIKLKQTNAAQESIAMATSMRDYLKEYCSGGWKEDDLYLQQQKKNLNLSSKKTEPFTKEQPKYQINLKGCEASLDLTSPE